MKNILRIHPSPRNLYGRGQKDIELNTSLEKHNLTKGDHINITATISAPPQGDDVQKNLQIRYERKDYSYPKATNNKENTRIYHFVFSGPKDEFELCVNACKRRCKLWGFPAED